MERKEHWEHIYQTKEGTQVSWYQPVPQTSLDMIQGLEVKKDAGIIDIGGGDSLLVDFLIDRGFSDITVLDISEEALARARKRLGTKGEKVAWIVADASEYHPDRKYDLWHDRATFHFLNLEEQKKQYLQTLNSCLGPGGNVILATFSEKGPTRCSGLGITQYSTEELERMLAATFRTMDCRNVAHQTPSGSIQDFSFCSFRKVSLTQKNR